MNDLGSVLREARNRKFLTVEEVSSITKIKEHYLVALESDEIGDLPARVYSIGFLKNLADLYELSQVELIMAYDSLRENGKRNDKYNKGMEEDLEYIKGIKKVEENYKEEMDDLDSLYEDTDYSFDKIKKLSIDEGENYEDSLNIIDDYISKSEDDLVDISKKKHTASSGTNTIENTNPTSKVMLEFEELMREEERFNTMKLRKQETERNINITKNKMKNRKTINLDSKKNGGGNIMILILLGIAIIVLLYIIINAILNM